MLTKQGDIMDAFRTGRGLFMACRKISLKQGKDTLILTRNGRKVTQYWK